MLKVKAKKFLGQHFLLDFDIARQIADTLDGFPDLPIIEVGPGTGVLTRFLLEKNRPLKAIELDRESIPYLKRHYPELGNNIIEGDFLKMDLDKIYLDQFCVIGNYPYNISSQIFFKILDYKDRIPCCAGMLQKEVAERIAAPPGGKTYGILSVFLQAWYDAEYLFSVDATAFEPVPKVKSGVIRLVRNKRESLGCDVELFRRIVKTTFSQRRKVLRNSMKYFLGKDNEIYSDKIFDERPERLSVDDFIKLTLMTEKYRPEGFV